jgi:hypothetical protein
MGTSEPPEPATAGVGPALARADSFLLLLLLYPLLLLAISSNWIFTLAGYIDPWVYYGYFRDLIALKNDSVLASHYYGSRLSWLLPGFLAHRFLNPEIASVVLHLGVYYVAVFSLYVTLRRAVGRRGALIAALLMGGYAFFLSAAGWDYVDGAGIAYCLLAVAFLTRAASGASPRANTLAAGAAAAAMVHANLICLVLCPLFGLYWLAMPRIRDRDPRPQGLQGPQIPASEIPIVPAAWNALGFFLAGALLLTALLCVINYWICGTWLFFLPSVRFALQSADSANPWAVPVAQWLPRAKWLALPLVVLAAVAVSSLAARKRRQPLPYPGAWGALFAIACFLFVVLESAGAPVLQLSYYASYLLPWLFLALGAALSPLLGGLSTAGFAAVAIACGVAFPFPLWGVNVWNQLAAPFGLWLPLAMGALLVPALLLKQPARGALPLALFALCACHATLAPFSHSPSQRHAARLSFLRIAHAAEQVRDRTAPADLLFWYDRQEPGFPEFLSLNSIFIWGHRTLGMDFPALPRDARLQPGTILVVPSARPGVAAQVGQQLRSRGLDAAPFGSEPVTLAGAPYQIHFLKVGPAPRALPSPLTTLAKIVRWTEIPLAACHAKSAKHARPGRQSDCGRRRLSRPFGSLSDVAINLFPNNPLGSLVQILIERRFDLQIFRPKSSLGERLGNPHHHRGVPLPLVAVGLQPVAAAQGGEQPSLPAVRQRELKLHRLLGLAHRSERLPHALNGGQGRAPLAAGGCALEQGRDLAQFFAQLLLRGHRNLNLRREEEPGPSRRYQVFPPWPNRSSDQPPTDERPTDHRSTDQPANRIPFAPIPALLYSVVTAVAPRTPRRQHGTSPW